MIHSREGCHAVRRKAKTAIVIIMVNLLQPHSNSDGLVRGLTIVNNKIIAFLLHEL